MRRPLAILSVALWLASPGPAADEPLHSLALIRSLSPEDAARGLSVSIEGVVTFYNPVHKELLVDDGLNGIYVVLPADYGKFAPFTVGARLRIEGVTQPGEFIPLIAANQISVLGQEKLPEPHRVVEGEFFSPALGCQWIEVPAVVLGAENRRDVFTLTAEISGRPVPVKIADTEDAAQHASELLLRPVTIRGMAGTVFNQQRQLTGRFLFVQSFDYITPSESSPRVEEAPLRAANELLRYGETAQSRIRVRGVVTQTTAEGFYLRGEGGCLLVRHAGGRSFPPGTKVQAEGFASVEPFRPALRATSISSIGYTAPPKPTPLDLSAAGLLRLQSELVTVNAEVLARPGAGAAGLPCRAGNSVFEAILPEDFTLPAEADAGAMVRLTGICDLITTHTLPPELVDGFRLRLRDPDGLAILRRAPWWNRRRVLWVLAAMATAALAGLAWIVSLRRRVAEQTRIIAAQLEQAVLKEERERIARELHDTLEQELAGAAAQLRNARRRFTTAPEQVEGAIGLAEKMLEHCRSEARSSIRDLRSVALEQRGLPGAIAEFVVPAAEECGARFELTVQGEPHPLPGSTDLHLLRIAHQAALNAAQHGKPQVIHVNLRYLSDSVALEIRDDGAGFDPAKPAPRGHFGILGIRERANKLHAALNIESTPGHGAVVRLTLPLSATPIQKNGRS